MKLQVQLAELEWVHSAMHARMATIAQHIVVGGGFFGLILVSFASYIEPAIFSAEHPSRWLVYAAPFPFFFLGLLTFREDLLMISHDEYFLRQLRPKILLALGEPEDSEMLGFLMSGSRLKIGDTLSAILSGLRYGFPFMGLGAILGCGIVFVEEGWTAIIVSLQCASLILILAILMISLAIYKGSIDKKMSK